MIWAENRLELPLELLDCYLQGRSKLPCYCAPGYNERSTSPLDHDGCVCCRKDRRSQFPSSRVWLCRWNAMSIPTHDETENMVLSLWFVAEVQERCGEWPAIVVTSQHCDLASPNALMYDVMFHLNGIIRHLVCNVCVISKLRKSRKNVTSRLNNTRIWMIWLSFVIRLKYVNGSNTTRILGVKKSMRESTKIGGAKFSLYSICRDVMHSNENARNTISKYQIPYSGTWV